MDSSNRGIFFLYQSANSASLLIDNVDSWTHIGAGLCIYVSFGKNASEENLDLACDTVLALPTQYDVNLKKNISVLESGGDVLLIPQACLLGKLKGKSIQYHSLIEKTKGEQLYQKLIDIMRKKVENQGEKSGKVCHGTYGNRQGLKLDSSGPNTHQLEF